MQGLLARFFEFTLARGKTQYLKQTMQYAKRYLAYVGLELCKGEHQVSNAALVLSTSIGDADPRGATGFKGGKGGLGGSMYAWVCGRVM